MVKILVLFLFSNTGQINTHLKPIFLLATLFARREAKTRIRQRDWVKLAGEKIRREQVGTVPIYLSVPANKFAKSKIGLRYLFKTTVMLISPISHILSVDKTK